MKLHALKLAFLTSHNGTVMRGIISALHAKILSGKPKVIISNNSDSPALQFAEEQKIPYYHISDQSLGSFNSSDEAISSALLKHKANLIILSGYMKKVGEVTRRNFPGKILNVHPALIPLHAGLWGDAVHKAVLDSKEKVTGVTIHAIDEEYDKGTILSQSKVKVLAYDTVETLRFRVQAMEIATIIALLKDIQSGKVILI